MALLVFREDELPEDPNAVGLVTAGTVRRLLEGDLGDGTPPTLPPESLRPDEYDEQCATVLVPAELFDAVKPLPMEMGYLAHLREGGRPDATRTGSTPELDASAANHLANWNFTVTLQDFCEIFADFSLCTFTSAPQDGASETMRQRDHDDSHTRSGGAGSALDREKPAAYRRRSRLGLGHHCAGRRQLRHGSVASGACG
ncbi:hypothetical protein ABT034_32105 [Streptomyces sp. NPDC002773]|uniref:hypothetical protein n=1 Tax=Streptomyces sp. NPDC002773 TaxID=3154430 RepID=UPI00332B1955